MGVHSGKDFLFTLKNPHNVQPLKLRLNTEFDNCAIQCHSNVGPWFGYDHSGMSLHDNCMNDKNSTNIGNNYTGSYKKT